MFLESYLELPLRWDRVRASMLRHPRPWLQGLAEVVDRAGQRLLVEVGLPIRGHELTRRAWLEVGEPVATDGVVSLPLRLRVENQEWLFPSLEGTLDTTWLGDARTYLALSAHTHHRSASPAGSSTGPCSTGWRRPSPADSWTRWPSV